MCPGPGDLKPRPIFRGALVQREADWEVEAVWEPGQVPGRLRSRRWGGEAGVNHSEQSLSNLFRCFSLGEVGSGEEKNSWN